jgi:hypothetical protein
VTKKKRVGTLYEDKLHSIYREKRRPSLTLEKYSIFGKIKKFLRPERLELPTF